MDFETRPPRARADSIVPMINIVFLLLIFFLITAASARPVPFPVAPPGSVAEDRADTRRVLFIAADGRLGYGEDRGDAVYARLAEEAAAEESSRPLLVRADRQLPGAELARVLTRLGQAGIARVRLVVGRP
ncbi:MAG: ExbD/TolR family protein [Paracoccaceae bacterium]